MKIENLKDNNSQKRKVCSLVIFMINDIIINSNEV